MTATVAEQPREVQLWWERRILPGVLNNLPQKTSIIPAHGHNTAKWAEGGLLCLGHAEISTKTCVNKHSPGLHKPKAWWLVTRHG